MTDLNSMLAALDVFVGAMSLNDWFQLAGVTFISVMGTKAITRR